MKRWMIIIAIVALLFIGVYYMNKKGVALADPDVAQAVEKWRPLVKKYAAQFGLPENLIMGDICVESSGNPQAISSVGALGLLQIMPDTLGDINQMLLTNYQPSDLYTPEVAIQCGCAYWNWLINVFWKGDVAKAIRSYFAGVGNVQKDPTEGTDYLNKVTAYWNYYNGGGNLA